MSDETELPTSELMGVRVKNLRVSRPFGTEPRGCPTPGACSCPDTVDAAVPAPSAERGGDDTTGFARFSKDMLHHELEKQRVARLNAIGEAIEAAVTPPSAEREERHDDELTSVRKAHRSFLLAILRSLGVTDPWAITTWRQADYEKAIAALRSQLAVVEREERMRFAERGWAVNTIEEACDEMDRLCGMARGEAASRVESEHYVKDLAARVRELEEALTRMKAQSSRVLAGERNRQAYALAEFVVTEARAVMTREGQ